MGSQDGELRLGELGLGKLGEPRGGTRLGEVGGGTGLGETGWRLAGGSRPAGSGYLVFQKLASWQDTAAHSAQSPPGSPTSSWLGIPEKQSLGHSVRTL